MNNRQRRNRERMQRHLETRCYISYANNGTRSRPTPCCGKYTHESCLANCFYYAPQPGDYTCPYCRQTILPYNIDEPFRPPAPPQGEFPFGFCTLTFIVHHGQFPINRHQDNEEYNFDPPVMPRLKTPPGFWVAVERIRQYYRENPCPELPNVRYRPG